MTEQWNPFAEFYTPEFQQRDLYDRFVRFQEVFPNHPDFMDFGVGEREYARNKVLGVNTSDELYKHLLESTKGADSTTRNRVFNAMMTDDPRWQEQWSLDDKKKARRGLGIDAIDPNQPYEPPGGRPIPTRQMVAPTPEESQARLAEVYQRDQEQEQRIQKELAEEAFAAGIGGVGPMAGVPSAIAGASEIPYVGEVVKPFFTQVMNLPGNIAETAGNVGVATRALMHENSQKFLDDTGMIDKVIGWADEQNEAVRMAMPERQVARLEDIDGVGTAIKWGLGTIGDMAGFMTQVAAGQAIGGVPGSLAMAAFPSIADVSREVREAGGEVRPELALPLGMAIAGLERLGFEQIGRAFTEPIKKKIRSTIVGKLLHKVEAAGMEGLTEGVQEIIQMGGGRIADEDRQLLEGVTQEEWSRLANAAAAGFVGGGGLASLGRGYQQHLTPEERAGIEQAEQEIAAVETLARNLVEQGMVGEQAIARGQQVAEGVPSELFDVPETGGATVLDAQGQPVQPGAPLERALEMVRGRQTPEQLKQEAGLPAEGERRTGERRSLIPEDVRERERLEFEERRQADRRLAQGEREEEVTQEQADAGRLGSLMVAEEGMVARLEEGRPIEGDTGERLAAIREEIRALGGQPTQQMPQEEAVPPPVRELPETAGVIGGREFAERAIPQLEERIGGLQQTLTDSDAFAQSDMYDGTYPIPRQGGIIAARNSDMYRQDPGYRAKVDGAIRDITETIVAANRQRMALLGNPSTGAFGVDYQVGKVQAGYGVNVGRAWNMEAKNKYPYTSYLGNVSVREALQNSLDAVLEALEEGQVRTGKINIETDDKNYIWSKGFTITDNGIGMSDVDIRDKFLALHGTGKDKVGRFGGFGIAKAVILGPADDVTWSLKTRDNFHTSDMAQNADEVGTLDKPMQGTEIYVASDSNDIIDDNARRYVEMTEIPGNVKLTFNGEPTKNPFKRKKFISHKSVIGEGATTVDAKYYPKPPAGYERKTIIRLVDEKTGAKLTQAIVPIWDDEFQGAVIVDLTTTATPGTGNYPLTDSRMEFQGEGRKTLDNIVKEYTVDRATAQRAGQKSKLETVGDRREWQKTLGKIHKDPLYQDMVRVVDEIYEETGEFFGHANPPITPLEKLPLKVDVGYKGYRGGSMFQARHLAAYEAVARLMASHAGAHVTSFYALLSKAVDGSSVISEYNAGLGQLGLNHLVMSKAALKSPLAYAMYLRDTLNHELTHFYASKHDENFTMAEAETQEKTAELFPYVLRIAEAVMGQQSDMVRKEIVEKEVVKEVPVDKIIETYLTPEQQQFLFEEMEQPRTGGLDAELYYPDTEGDAGAGGQLDLFRRAVDRGDVGLPGAAEPDADRGTGEQPDTQGDVEAVERGVGAGAVEAEPTGESAAAAAREASAAEAARKRRLDARGQRQKDVEKEAERKEKRKVKAEAKKKAKQQAFIPNEVQEKILAAIKGGLHTVSEIEEQTGIHKGALRRNFKTLAAAGEIVLGKQPTGRGDTDRQYATLPGEAVPDDVAPVNLKEEAAAKKQEKKAKAEEAEARKETPFERVKREYEQETTERERELEDRRRSSQAGLLQITTGDGKKKRDAAAREEQSEWRERYWRDYLMRGGPGRSLFTGKGRMSAGQQKAWDRTKQSQEAAIKGAQADRRLIDDIVRKHSKTRKDRNRVGKVMVEYLTGEVTRIEMAGILDIDSEHKSMVALEGVRDRNTARHKALLESGLLPMDVKAALQDKEFYLRLAYARFLLDKRLFSRFRRYQPTEVDKKEATDTIEAAFKKEIERVAKETQAKAFDLPSGFDMVTFLKDTKWKNTQDMLESLNNPKLAKELVQMRERVQKWTKALQFERSLDGFGVRAIRNADGVRDYAANAIQNLLDPKSPLDAGGELKNTHNLERRVLSDVFKKLYGEIEDPGVLQALTTETQGNILAQARFFDEMLLKGEDLVWTREANNTRMSAKLGSQEKDTDVFRYGSLAGAYVTPEFKDFLDGKGQIHASLKDLAELGNPDARMYAAVLGAGYQRLQGTTRMMALMTMGAWWRNLVSSYATFALQSGDALHPSFTKNFIKSTGTALSAWVGTEGGMRRLSKDMEEGAFNYTQASIVTDLKPAVGVTAQRLWEGDEPIMSGWRVAKNIPRKLKELYILIDYAAKKAAWQLRYDIAKKKGLSDELAIQHAREHVEKYYQNANRVPAALQAVGVAGFADFLGFKYDSGRMAVNAMNNIGMSLASRKKSEKGTFAAKWKGVTNEHPELMDTWQPIVGFTAARIWPVAFGLWGPGQYLLAFGSNVAEMSVKGIKMVQATMGLVRPDDEPEEITEVDEGLQAAVNEITESYNANMPKWTAKSESKDGEKSIVMIPLGSQFGNAAEDFMLGYAQRLNSGGETAEEILESNTRPENLLTFLPIGMAYSNMWEMMTGFDPQTQFRQANITDAIKQWRAGQKEEAKEEAKDAFINFIADTAGGLGRSYKAAQIRGQRAGRDPQKGVSLKKYDEDTAADVAWEVAKPLVRLLRVKTYDREEVLRILPYKLGSSSGMVRGSRQSAREAARAEQKLGEATPGEIARSQGAMQSYVDGLYDAESRMDKMMPLFEYLDVSKEAMVTELLDRMPIESSLTRAEAEAVVYGKVDDYIKSEDMYKPEAKPTRRQKGDDRIREMLTDDPLVPADHIVGTLYAEGYDVESMYKSEKYTPESRLRVHIRTMRDEILEKKTTTTLYD